MSYALHQSRFSQGLSNEDELNNPKTSAVVIVTAAQHRNTI
jgi:hypothetical protein